MYMVLVVVNVQNTQYCILRTLHDDPTRQLTYVFEQNVCLQIRDKILPGCLAPNLSLKPSTIFLPIFHTQTSKGEAYNYDNHQKQKSFKWEGNAHLRGPKRAHNQGEEKCPKNSRKKAQKQGREQGMTTFPI